MEIPRLANESDETFVLRRKFVSFTQKIPDTYISKISIPAAIMYSHMFVKKVQFGVTYDEVSEKIIEFVTALIPE